MKKWIAGMIIATSVAGCISGPVTVKAADSVTGTAQIGAPAADPTAQPTAEPTPLEPAEIVVNPGRFHDGTIGLTEAQIYLLPGTITNPTNRDLLISAHEFPRAGNADPTKAVFVNNRLMVDGVVIATVPRTTGTLAYDPEVARFPVKAKSTVDFQIRPGTNFSEKDIEALHAKYAGYTITDKSFQIIGGGTVKGPFPISWARIFCAHIPCTP